MIGDSHAEADGTEAEARTRRTIIILASYTPSFWNFRAELIRELDRRGYEVVCCGPAHADALRMIRPLGATFVDVRLGRTSINPIGDLLYCLRLVRLFIRRKPAAIFGYTAKPVIWGGIAAGIAGVPRAVAMITGLGASFATGRGWHRLLSALMMRLYRTAMRNFDSVIFHNPDDQREWLNRRLVQRHTSFVVNGSGVDVEKYSVAPLPSEPVFLVIARIIREKGIREFCSAALRVKKQNSGARFRIVGWFDAGPSAIGPEELRSLCADGAIEYAGAVDDVRGELAAARVFVLPSYREGTPRTVLEAMAMGRPIITTDVPGCRETVREGWNGYVVPPRDPQALAEAMNRFLSDPALASLMGANSRALAVAKYDARKVATATVHGSGL